jgi:hypothetical protein
MWRWNPRGERSFARAGLGADDVLMNALDRGRYCFSNPVAAGYGGPLDAFGSHTR